MFKFKSGPTEPVLRPENRLTQQQTKRVRDLVMMRSHGRPLGRWCRCPRSCYSPHNVRSIYCTCGLLAICSLAVLLGIWIGAARWYYYANEFVPTVCTPLVNASSGEPSVQVCSCKGIDHRAKSQCRSAIPCVQIWIRYKLPNEEEIDTLLHETHTDIQSNWQCTHIPRPCFRQRAENVAFTEDFRQQWGDPSRSYRCYHHPEHAHDVVRVQGGSPHRAGLAFHGLLWPAVCSIVFFLGLLLPTLICGCQYIWGNRVPPGIMEQDQQIIPLEMTSADQAASSTV